VPNETAMTNLRDAVATYGNKYTITPTFQISDLFDIKKDWVRPAVLIG
jgi:hypothetical protein